MESDLTFSTAQWEAVLYVLVATLFCVLAGFVYALSTRGEVSARYRPAITASALVQLVATVSYVALVLSWIVGYDARGALHVPNDGFRFDNGLRYMDWTVSVPLLTVELVGISVLSGARALRARSILVPSAVLMVVTGFLGEDVFGDRGQDATALLVWGAISTVPFVVAYLMVFRICAESARALPDDIGRTVRNIGFLFALTWGVYPLGYLVQVFAPDSAAWGVTRQISFSVATIAAKVGFGVLSHKVAKMRTAHDIATGEGSHEEDVWLSSVELASARPALGAYLAAHSDVVQDAEPYPGEVPDRTRARRAGTRTASRTS